VSHDEGFLNFLSTIDQHLTLILSLLIATMIVAAAARYAIAKRLTLMGYLLIAGIIVAIAILVGVALG
jgi:hypothetical protein